MTFPLVRVRWRVRFWVPDQPCVFVWDYQEKILYTFFFLFFFQFIFFRKFGYIKCFMLETCAIQTLTNTGVFLMMFCKGLYICLFSISESQIGISHIIWADFSHTDLEFSLFFGWGSVVPFGFIFISCIFSSPPQKILWWLLVHLSLPSWNLFFTSI